MQTFNANIALDVCNSPSLLASVSAAMPVVETFITWIALVRSEQLGLHLQSYVVTLYGQKAPKRTATFLLLTAELAGTRDPSPYISALSGCANLWFTVDGRLMDAVHLVRQG